MVRERWGECAGVGPVDGLRVREHEAGDLDDVKEAAILFMGHRNNSSRSDEVTCFYELEACTFITSRNLKVVVTTTNTRNTFLSQFEST